MNMVQNQPLQTTVLVFFLGNLLDNERTEEIYDFKSIGVLIKVKLLKRNPSHFSLLKDVFKMAAERNESIAVCQTVAVPCRTYWTLPLTSHGDPMWECWRQTRTTATSPHFILTFTGTCPNNNEMNSSFMAAYHDPSHTKQTKRQKPDVSIHVTNCKTTGWAKVNFSLTWTSIHYPN